MDKKLILIDGSSFIFRAFHAMPNLTSPSQKPTGATYGITNMLKQMLKKYSEYNWCCVFDAPGKTFRHEIYPEYKANRAETPQELIPQFEDIYSIIPALGIPVVIEPEVEADDVIGTLAIEAKQMDYEVLIATGDKDFAQLVQEKITLINTMTNEILDTQGVRDKFGVNPTQIIDYLALVGDKVDNVPGVQKCGPKTASKWLNHYQTLDNLISHSQDITGVVGENLRNGLSQLEMSKNLVTIRTNINLSHVIPYGIEALILAPEEPAKLRSIYAQLGFKTWLSQLNESQSAELFLATPDINTHSEVRIDKQEIIFIRDSIQFQKIINQLKRESNSGELAINLIKGLNHRIDYVLFSHSGYVYLAKNVDLVDVDLFSDEAQNSGWGFNLLKELEELLISDIPKVLVNYKESLGLVKKNHLSINRVVDDITLLHYVCNSKISHSIQYIYKEYLGGECLEVSPLVLQDSQLSLEEQAILMPQIVIVKYAMEVVKKITGKLSERELNLYRHIELPLVLVLVEIELTGIKLDVGEFMVLQKEIGVQIKQLEEKIYAQAKCVFNINSAKQLQDVLFNQLKLSSVGIKKNTNGYSTDEDSLRHLLGQGVDIAGTLIEYRGLSKLQNTYISKLPPLVDNLSKLHTTFEQAQVISGRLSSKDPNLQNIPVKSSWGRQIRHAFIASENCKLICADYSQIELRILAHFSQDANLINAFNHNMDIHSITASEIFHKSVAEVSKEERRYAKTINFSLLYGKTVYGLANELGIDRATAKLYIDTYFSKYPMVLKCLEGIKSLARNNGYVETLYGRRIYLPNINASNKILREAEERVALNSPMQGTSADIIKIAMRRIYDYLIANNLQTKLILQVHDELILDVPNDEVEIITAQLANLMSNDFGALSVKLAVDIKVANNWDDAH